MVVTEAPMVRKHGACKVSRPGASLPLTRDSRLHHAIIGVFFLQVRVVTGNGYSPLFRTLGFYCF